MDGQSVGDGERHDRTGRHRTVPPSTGQKRSERKRVEKALDQQPRDDQIKKKGKKGKKKEKQVFVGSKMVGSCLSHVRSCTRRSHRRHLSRFYRRTRTPLLLLLLLLIFICRSTFVLSKRSKLGEKAIGTCATCANTELINLL